MFVAAWHGHVDIVKALLRSGASVRIRNNDGSSVLQAAARHSAVLCMVCGTDAKLDVNYQDNLGFTALMQAVNINSLSPFLQPDYTLTEDRLRCIAILLDSGVDVNQLNTFGRSALMSAAFSHSVRLVSALLAAGARVDTVCKNGKRAVDYTSDVEVKRLLQTPRLAVCL